MQAGTASAIDHGRTELNKILLGQAGVVDQCLLALLCRGHVLLEGVPGIGKTLLGKLVGHLVGLKFQRVQCTSDLMPADISGGNILNAATSKFELHRGPVFTDLLLVDEINRMPPRTQAALLEAMEERQVTIDGIRHSLARDFTVFATQNPVEFEGTYPLPEAQLDRFLLKVKMGYPSANDEVEVLASHHRGFDAHDLSTLDLKPLPAGWLEEARDKAAHITIQPELLRYVSNIVRKTREWPALMLGASPRAGVALMQVAKAKAVLDGRDYLIPDDVKSVVAPTLRHRVRLRPEAELEGFSSDDILTQLVGSVEVPR
ncbi:MAG TPA: MoxR family ATPase [Terriglobales bacterium]|nr:MoxR family ATPase [Terriglobales bacterium]